MSGNSAVVYFGKEDGSSCGYCKSNDGFLAYGMWAYRLTVQDYQDLIDRGFRRSGHFVYKPEMRSTCCPLYTIRNRVADFQPSSSHRRILKRVAHFLNTGERPRPGSERSDHAAAGDAPPPGKPKAPSRSPPKVQADGDRAEPKPKEGKARYKRWNRKLDRLRSLAEKRGETFEALLADYNRRRQARLDKNKPKSLEDLLNLARPDAKHKLTFRLVRTTPRSPEYEEHEDREHALYVQYQMKIHGDARSECEKRRYERFLVESPLEEEGGALPCGYGSFHFQYWLDDRLIAASVLDFLPYCISSVYFVYDVEYEFLSLGTYSALKEIQMTREMCRSDPAVQYYYLGYYVHSCQKMRYKGQYSGSDLLCPETYTWHPIEKVRPMLDVRKYCRFCPDIHAVDEGCGVPEMCTLAFQGARMTWDNFKRLRSRTVSAKGKKNRKDPDADVYEYASLVGADCCRRMLLLRQ